MLPLFLTPSVDRGKRPIRDELELRQKAQAILKTHRLEGFLSFSPFLLTNFLSVSNSSLTNFIT